jgi:3-ketosteroid 9alpha-monooxygenase subunit A
MSKISKMGYPEGWFIVCFSNELGLSEIKRLQYFGKELVAFRDEHGSPHVLDAYCPHLGAHLGAGGVIDGGTVRCPFHGWRFDGTGICVEIPGVKVIPLNAKLYSWPVLEVNDLIFIYYGRFHKQPFYEIPRIIDYGKNGWLRWQGRTTRRIQAYAGDIVENMADISHFKQVHFTELNVASTVLTFNSHIAELITTGKAHPPAVKISQTISYKSTYYGPSYEITEYAGEIGNYILVAHTPVDEDWIDLRYAMFSPYLESEERTNEYIQEITKSLSLGLETDIKIWESKMYRENPLLCETDIFIPKIRRWYQQFYST